MQKLLIIVKFYRKLLIWVKICQYLDFGRNFRKISIVVNSYGNLDFGQSL